MDPFLCTERISRCVERKHIIGGRIGQGRRLEYGGNENNRQRRMIEGGNGQNNGNNLNENGDLIVLD